MDFVVKNKSENKTRNPFVVKSKQRKGGVMRSKKDKRQNGKNKQQKYLSEDY